MLLMHKHFSEMMKLNLTPYYSRSLSNIVIHTYFKHFEYKIKKSFAHLPLYLATTSFILTPISSLMLLLDLTQSGTLSSFPPNTEWPRTGILEEKNDRHVHLHRLLETAMFDKILQVF